MLRGKSKCESFKSRYQRLGKVIQKITQKKLKTIWKCVVAKESD